VRCAVMLSLLAFAAACRSASTEVPPEPSHAQLQAPITASPAEAPPLGATPPPTTGTTVPPPTAGAPIVPGSECRSDSDCSLTYVPEEGCCPTMCAPRGVTTAEARRREGLVQGCEQKRGHPCPVPACRARPFQAACEGGLCTARVTDDR